jgi:type IV secretory pathway VirB9-like protein
LRKMFGWTLAALLCATSSQAQTKTATASAKGVVREVRVTDSTIEDITVRAGVPTLLMFAEGEDIVKLSIGDAPLWLTEQLAPNVLSVKPTTDGTETILHITTTSGKIRSLFLRERKNVVPDAKVSVITDFEPGLTAQKFYSAAEVDAIKRELELSTSRLESFQREAGTKIDQIRATLPASLSYYRVENKPPFYVEGMATDGERTYVKVSGPEAPVMFELIDGKPSPINLQVQNGHTYIATKVLGKGWFVLGKMRQAFAPADAGGN